MKCPSVWLSFTLTRNPTANRAADAVTTTKTKTRKRLKSCCCASSRILRCGVVRIVAQSSARITTATAFQLAIAAIQGRRCPRAAKNTAVPAANPSTRRCRASCREIISTRRTLAAGFLYREPEISPPAPFVMRSALLIATASLLFVRVRSCDEFRERSVHLDIV
ncbi:MAG: hypothetical protein Udaeo_13080 [Candidatus Udaeobacter sp.]|nr:MAG: hypothetical protein Udaeo_13080 [Candidatus Udaeobacter sp.]